MRKMFVMSVCVAVVATGVVLTSVMNNSPMWERLDAQGVCGGACLQYSGIVQCAGGSTECHDVQCGIQGGPDGHGHYVCPPFGYNYLMYAHRNLVVRKQDVYYSGVRSVESYGRTASKSIEVVCYKTITCAATNCAPGRLDGEYYCTEASTEDADTESGVELSGNSC